MSEPAQKKLKSSEDEITTIQSSSPSSSSSSSSIPNLSSEQLHSTVIVSSSSSSFSISPPPPPPPPSSSSLQSSSSSSTTHSKVEIPIQRPPGITTGPIKLYDKLPIKILRIYEQVSINVTSETGEVKEIPQTVPYNISLIDNKTVINDPPNCKVEWFFWDDTFTTCKSFITTGVGESKWKPFSEENSNIVERAFQQWDRTPKVLCQIWNGRDTIEINYQHNGYLCQKNFRPKPIGRVAYRWAWQKKNKGEPDDFENYEKMEELEHSYRSSKVFEEVCTPSRTEYKVNLVQKYQVSLGGAFHRREVRREASSNVSILSIRRLNFDGVVLDLNTIAPPGIAWTRYDNEGDLNIERPAALNPVIGGYLPENYLADSTVKIYGHLPLYKTYIFSILQTLKEISERNISIQSVQGLLIDPVFSLNKFANECYMWCPYADEDAKNDMLNGPVDRVNEGDDKKGVCARLYFNFEDALRENHVGIFLCRVNLGITKIFENTEEAESAERDETGLIHPDGELCDTNYHSYIIQSERFAIVQDYTRVYPEYSIEKNV